MDINNELERLILKYDIYKPFPSYRKTLGDGIDIACLIDDVKYRGEFLLGHRLDGEPYCGLGYAIEKESEKLRQAKNIGHLVEAMQKLIFLFVYSKDFVNAFRLIEIYIRKKYEGFEQYLQFRKGLKSLFQQISGSLQDKKGTVCYMLSPFEYGWEQGMPYLEGVSLESICFDNAYVTASETEDIMGSAVCSMESEYLPEREFSGCWTSALALWGLLGEMLAEESRSSYLIQIPTDIYIPWVFPDISGKTCTSGNKDSQGSHNGEFIVEKHLLARKYVDRQLGFYDPLLGSKVTKVYLGIPFGTPSSCHAMMIVKNTWRESLRVSSYFSNADCCKLLERIVKGQ